MTKNSLEKLILDLNNLEKNFDKIFEEKYDNIMARLFVLIGKTTAYDTGVSREVINNILSDLNRPDLQNELEHKIYEFWKKRKYRENEGVSYKLTKVNGKYNILIDDYGIGNQNDGKVSDIHPRQDSNIIPRHIDEALDKFDTDVDRDIVRAFNELETMICYIIERGI